MLQGCSVKPIKCVLHHTPRSRGCCASSYLKCLKGLVCRAAPRLQESRGTVEWLVYALLTAVGCCLFLASCPMSLGSPVTPLIILWYESLLLSQGFILRITGCTGRLSWLCKVPFTPRFAEDWSDLQKLNNVLCQLGLLPEPGSVSLVLLFVVHIMDWEYRSAPPGPAHHRNLNRFVNFGHIRHYKGTYACRELQLWWVLWIKMAIWSFISHSGGLYAKHFSRC